VKYLIDSNIIFYSCIPDYKFISDFIIENIPAISVISKIEVLGYNKISANDYYAFGQILRAYNSGDFDDRYKFTEKERDDETGLDYFGARYYDSDIARWLSVDPLADKYPGWSPYNYCQNNPLVFIDPNGQDWFYYQSQGEENASWHYADGHEANYIDIDGNKQTNVNGYEYLIIFTITGKNEEGAAVGRLEMWHQNNKMMFKKPSTGEVNPFIENVFSGGHSFPSIAEGNWFMDLSERPKPSFTNLDETSYTLNHIGKGIQKFPDGKYGNYFPGLDWGTGRIKLNFEGPEDDGYGKYLHGKLINRNYTHACVCDRSAAIVNYFWNNQEFKGVVPFQVIKK